MDDRELSARLDALAARLSRVEEVVGLATPEMREPAAPVTVPASRVEMVAPAGAPPPPIPPQAELEVSEPVLTPPPALPTVETPCDANEEYEGPLTTFVAPDVDEPDVKVTEHPPRQIEELRHLLQRAEAPPTKPQYAAESQPFRAAAAGPLGGRPARAPRPALEVIIGERWMAWVGAIIVVVGVGFFVKLGYDMGWWGMLPPIVKCLAAAGFGAGLVVAGEVALRRVGRMAAVSLYGAGLGTLYLTAYATFRWFELVPQAGAFGLMFCVARLGIGLPHRGRMLALGVLSLLGGYGTPILLHEQATFAAALPLYVSALLVIALVLSARIAEPFRVLRYVALGLHVAVATAWLMQEGESHWLLAMVFLTLWWGLVTVEALYAAKREQSARGNPIVTLLTTFWYVTAGCGVLAAAEPGARNWLGIFTGGVAGVCAWAALALTGIGVLRVVPRRAMDLMTTALWAQVGVLLAAAIGLHFHGQSDSFGESLGWIVMGVACVELGRRLPSRGVDVFGLIVGTLGVWWVWAVNKEMAALHRVMWSYGDLALTRWALLAFTAVLATYVVARRLRCEVSDASKRSCAVLALAATVQWLAAWPEASRALVLTTGWLVVAGVLLGTARLASSHGYRLCGLILLVAGVGRWLVLDAFWTRCSPGWAADLTAPVLNWQMAVAILAVTVMVVGFADRLVQTRRRVVGLDGPVVPETWAAWQLKYGDAVFDMRGSGLMIGVTSQVEESGRIYALRLQSRSAEPVEFVVQTGERQYDGSVVRNQDSIIHVPVGASSDLAVAEVKWTYQGKRHTQYIFLPQKCDPQAHLNRLTMQFDNATYAEVLQRVAKAYGVVILASGDLQKVVPAAYVSKGNPAEVLYHAIEESGADKKQEVLAPSIYVVEPAK